MLVELGIENLAIVDSVTVELDAGFTVLTGETGAGKSILIDALLLALGERADNTAIRSGAERAEIHALFAVEPDSRAAKWLEQEEIALEQGLCLVRRVLHRRRASRCTINASTVSAGKLREFGRLLVDIHGQHAHQSLSQSGAPQRLLDQFAGLTNRVDELARIQVRLRERQRLLAEAQASRSLHTERLELLEFQIEELEGLGLEAGEWERLDVELRRLSNARTLAETAGAAAEALRADDTGLLDGLERIRANLAQAGRLDPDLDECAELLDAALVHAKEAAATLARYLDGVEIDDARAALLEERIARAHQLARKHQVDPTKLWELQDELARQRDALVQAQQGTDNLERALAQIRSDYDRLAGEISAARNQAAPRLAAAAAQRIRELGMPAAQLLFDLSSTPDAEPGPTGYDQVTACFSANPGEAPLPLARVASGGELSRLSLALHLAVADDQRPATMIFDEVDAGIGGGIAHRVGNYLREISRQNQVLCVTHQPQVAAQGDHHLGISKQTRAGRTTTRVTHLSAGARRDEIARMLAGATTSETTRRHAAELLGEPAGAG